MTKRRAKKWVLGFGLDDAKGHTHLTRGDNFLLVGGSKETHQEMTEKVIKLNEELTKRRKTLDDISNPELGAIAEKLKLCSLKINHKP